jgi:hypothetical protein
MLKHITAVRSGIFTAMKVKIALFGDLKRHINLIEVTDVSKDRTTSNLRIEE